MMTATSASSTQMVAAVGLGNGAIMPTLRVNGPKDNDWRLPNTLSVGIAGVVASRLLNRIGGTVAASAGSACHSSHDDDDEDGGDDGGDANANENENANENVTVSSVLRAMRVPREWAVGTLRLSCGKTTTLAEVETAAAAIADAYKELTTAVIYDLPTSQFFDCTQSIFLEAN
jgi:cysteine desulfurase